MFAKTSFFTLALASLTAISVSAQAALPDPRTVPAACGTPCGDVIEVVTLCSQQYTSNTTDETACVCSGLPSTSAISSCISCLNSNSALTLGAALSLLPTVCSDALDSCAFECDVTPCRTNDVACQCGSTFLQGILNCASCNTANGNNNATTIQNYNELRDSCIAQNYTTSIPSSTQALPSPTGQDGYVAPTLTNTAGVTVATTRASTGIIVGAGGSSTTVVTPSAQSSGAASSVLSVASSLSRSASATGASSTGTRTGTAAPAASTSAPPNSASKVATGSVFAGLVVVVGIAALL